MALTQAQLNARAVALILDAFPPAQLGAGGEAHDFLVSIARSAIRYVRAVAPGPERDDRLEAARRIVVNICERIVGHSPITAQELHWLRFHLAHEAEPGSAGEL